ncbi:Fe/S biogenesis protein NfuA [Trichinella spiralis]|uniref:Fe/S biogenesis protein NfuA n=1 Tax=Trichinella spiralis TaxID=6334 RepID=A0ABR3KGH9_TRISP
MQARYSCHSVTMVVVVVVVVSANNNNYGYGQRYGNDVTERANYFKAAHLKKQTKPPIGLQHQLTAPTRLNVNNCFFHNNNNDDDDDDGDDNITNVEITTPVKISVHKEEGGEIAQGSHRGLLVARCVSCVPLSLTLLMLVL